MATRVRSHAKINLGLGIGAPRPDGFHALTTVYQTLEIHDVVTVSAKPAASTSIRLTTNHERVPTDERNTAWKIVEKSLRTLGRTADVEIHIEKRLPVQGGLGAGSANAAAALIGMEQSWPARIVPSALCRKGNYRITMTWAGPTVWDGGQFTDWRLQQWLVPMCRFS